MDIDLSLLHNNQIEEIEIDNSYDLPASYYENTEIISLKKIKIKGRIIQKENDIEELDDYIECQIKGIMIIPDSISLEEVEYPFEVEYNDFIPESCRKNKNTLDIFMLLWENTVLEVPLQFTRVRDLSKFHGDGWRLVSEDELKQENNPFKDLIKDFEKEW